jgi:G:T/U-mismatch repair DNA glycosylase
VHPARKYGTRTSQDRELNDFSALKNIAPALRLVCFNGKEAAKSEELLLGLGYVTRVLPILQQRQSTKLW